MQIDKVVALSVDVDDWDKYIGYMAHDYRDIWINHYDLDDSQYTDAKFSELLDSNYEFKRANRLLIDGTINYIALRCDID